jgi:hypothetical protein
LWHVYKSESSKFPPVVRRAYGNKELKPVKSLSPRRTSQVLLTLLILCGLQLPALATTHNVKTNCGAAGNGSTNDTAAINTCIGDLANGDTLEFPAGTYLVTSLNPITVNNVTIDGSSNTATIKSTTTQQGPFFVVGSSGLGQTNSPHCSGWPGVSNGSALSATANENATSFSTTSALSGISTGGYVLLLEGGKDSSGGSGDTACDTSGCRGELVKIANVSGSTYTVDTALHDTFSPSANAAIACPVTGMISGVTVQNITFDGGTTTAQTAGNSWGVQVNNCVGCTVSGATFQNVLGSALLHTLNYDTTFSNITVTGAGSEGCGAAFQGYQNSKMTFSGISLASLNPGTNRGRCLIDGAFGLEEVGLDNSTVGTTTVNSSGTSGGRPMKLTATRGTTFNTLTVKNGCCAFNGLSLEYYSSHNTFDSCAITNNGGSGTGNGNAGINSFGNYNQFNSFNNCTVKDNGNVQILINNFDALRLGQDSNVTINGTTVGGAGTGVMVNASNACINNNAFVAGSGLTAGIYVMNNTNAGSGNVLNGYSSNLPAGTCQSGQTPPKPPTGLAAAVQ